jgi:hypothetical protein
MLAELFIITSHVFLSLFQRLSGMEYVEFNNTLFIEERRSIINITAI